MDGFFHFVVGNQVFPRKESQLILVTPASKNSSGGGASGLMSHGTDAAPIGYQAVAGTLA